MGRRNKKRKCGDCNDPQQPDEIRSGTSNGTEHNSIPFRASIASAPSEGRETRTQSARRAAQIANNEVVLVPFRKLFQFVYRTPPERDVVLDYRRYLPRRPQASGFAVNDRVLLVGHGVEMYTGMVYFPGDANDPLMKVRLDHLELDDDESEVRVLPHNCRIIPYPDDEREMKIMFVDFICMRLEYEHGIPIMSMENMN